MRNLYKLIFSAFLLSPLLLQFSQAIAAPADKVEVCHVPPGNTGKPVLIKVAASAVAAHRAHGDLVPAEQDESSIPGGCSDGIDNDCNGLIDSQDPACSRNFRYVFVTSAKYNGDLKTAAASLGATSGLDAADKLCNKAVSNAIAANPSSLLVGAKPFTAWLSDSNTNAADRITGIGKDKYVLLSGETVLLSTNTYPLSTLQHAISTTELLTVLGSGDDFFVWTNTLVSGTAFGESCSDFTSAAPGNLAGIGYLNFTSPNWTQVSDGDCSFPVFHLYCFEND